MKFKLTMGDDSKLYIFLTNEDEDKIYEALEGGVEISDSDLVELEYFFEDVNNHLQKQESELTHLRNVGWD